MVNATGIVDAMNPMLVEQPEHPIFEGIDLPEDNTFDFWSQLGDDDHIDLVSTTEFGFAEVLAVESETGIPWIAYWDGETSEGDFYDGSMTFAGGPRLFLSAGSDDDPNTWGEKNITETGDQIVINAIAFLTGDSGTPPVTSLPNDCSGDGAVDATDLACILEAGGPEALSSLLEESGLIRGDINGDGTVDFPDFLALSGNFNMEVTSYTQGDLNGDGTVDFPDFLTLSMNFNKSGGGAAAATPEPTGLCLMAFVLPAIGMLRRRKA